MATQWIRSNDVIWEEMDSEALLVSSATGASWSLNAAAAGIWKLCDGVGTLNELAQDYAQVTGRTVSRSRREIHSFCAAFVELGLLNSREVLHTVPGGVGAVVFMHGSKTPPAYRSLGLGGTGPRRRPSPRGNSGPG